MLCSVLFVLYLTFIRILAEKQFNCTFPPFPKNGFHLNRILRGFGWIDDPELLPNEETNKVKSFDLKLKCFDGYTGIGSDSLICYEDGRMVYADFECIPNCEQFDNLMSCGTDNRCVIHPKQESQQEPKQESDILFRSNGNEKSEDYDDCGFLGPAAPTYKPGQGAGFASGGRKAEAAELPWHAGIYSKKTRPYMQICGGTIITPILVISAAHCFWNEDTNQQPASEFAVAVGKLYRPWNEPHDRLAQKSDVAEIRIPAHFQGHATNLQEDIALVIVTSPFKFGIGVRHACLNFNEDFDQEQLKPRTFGKVAGWGLTSENGPAAPVLQVVELPVVDIRECFQNTDPGFRSHITGDKFCAGLKNGTAVCKGDSGGGFFVPYFHTDASKFRYYLRGIVSGSPQNENLCNVNSWASFTHVVRHERFILKTLEEISQYNLNSNK